MKKLIVCILMLCSCSLASLHIAVDPSDCTLYSIEDKITITCKIFEEKEHIGSYTFVMHKSADLCRENINVIVNVVNCHYQFGTKFCITSDENGVETKLTRVRTNTREECLRVYHDLKQFSKKYE